MPTRPRARGIALATVLTLAAVAPGAAELDARCASVLSQLQTLRSQFALYALQHGDQLPTLSQLQAGWGVIVHPTLQNGRFSEAGISQGRFPDGSPAPPTFGPYLAEPPTNPWTHSSRVVPADAPPAADAGWVYDERTGRIRAVLPRDADVRGLDPNESRDFVRS